MDRLGGDLGLVDRRDGIVWFGSIVRPQVNRGVLSPGSCTIVTCTFLPRCASSVMIDSVTPFMGVLGAAARRLQRDAAVGQRRSDLDDRAPVSRPPGAVMWVFGGGIYVVAGAVAVMRWLRLDEQATDRVERRAVRPRDMPVRH